MDGDDSGGGCIASWISLYDRCVSQTARYTVWSTPGGFESWASDTANDIRTKGPASGGERNQHEELVGDIEATTSSSLTSNIYPSPALVYTIAATSASATISSAATDPSEDQGHRVFFLKMLRNRALLRQRIEGQSYPYEVFFVQTIICMSYDIYGIKS